MAGLISELVQKAGIDAGTAEKGVGALLSTLQKYVPKESYSAISSAIPNAGKFLSAFQTTASEQGSKLSGLAELAGSLLGSKTEQVSKLISDFSAAGLSLESAKEFLPVVLNYIKEHGSADTVKSIEQHIPGLVNLVKGADAGDFLGKLKKLF
jgi:hypothetical protein